MHAAWNVAYTRNINRQTDRPASKYSYQVYKPEISSNRGRIFEKKKILENYIRKKKKKAKTQLTDQAASLRHSFRTEFLKHLVLGWYYSKSWK